ncbi:tRNA (uridine(54)-C5)-methyltransferase TrmA [Nitrosophilus kaiyonis]|uniref:tRNA (uridine(54)-C5)-methyltransferase TrmA n=1 Tax=Nitrosophilus kaiyonis TaxID=2930200 RepID=UPI0024934855|nr:tRNA (uridine(54)-C5)-methyltransferase TrmA [Nitrosophilus kaiyonis]
MECKYFGKCGSCKIYNLGYDGQLNLKVDENRALFEDFFDDFEIFKSLDSHFRARGEFRITNHSNISYSMYGFDKKLIKIDECPIMLKPIFNLMPKLIEKIKKDEVLSYKLFRVDFLSSLNNQTLVSLIYHKPIDEIWEKSAKKLEDLFDIFIIGRSKGVKRVLSQDFIIEKLKILDKKYLYKQIEGSFTQPNPYINQKMITWAKKNSKNFYGDLLELYCGNGNFTLPLSENFDKVLATEVSKSSIKAAKENIKLNSIKNIKFARLSSEEFVEAFYQKREFRRLKEQEIDLKKYNFSTVFVDPPRAGLDDTTRELVKEFENIIYISCNPITLKRDLKELIKTYKIKKFAFFDQFPYTPHLECGVILSKKI